MAFRVRRVKRVFGFDETETERYVVVPDRATVVSYDHLCDQIAETTGVNEGRVHVTLYGLVCAMKTFIRQGHSVSIEGFGTFIPSFNAKSSVVETEANVDSITKVKLRFVPCAELRKLLNEIEFEFDVHDSTNDTKTAEEETEGTEEPDDNEEEAVPHP